MRRLAVDAFECHQRRLPDRDVFVPGSFAPTSEATECCGDVEPWGRVPAVKRGLACGVPDLLQMCRRELLLVPRGQESGELRCT